MRDYALGVLCSVLFWYVGRYCGDPVTAVVG
jgi:hypothetical protein